MALPLFLHRLTREEVLEREAYHEGGHAVVLYHGGGWLGPAGVKVVGGPYCDGRCPGSHPESALVPYDLAGICAEFEFHPDIEPFASLEQVDRAILKNARGEKADSDLEHAMATLRRFNPSATHAMLYARYQEYGEATYDLLQRPEIVRAITAVSEELLEKGQLDGDEVLKLYRRATRHYRQ